MAKTLQKSLDVKRGKPQETSIFCSKEGWLETYLAQQNFDSLQTKL